MSKQHEQRINYPKLAPEAIEILVKLETYIRGSGLEPMFDKIVGVHKIGNFTVISED